MIFEFSGFGNLAILREGEDHRFNISQLKARFV